MNLCSCWIIHFPLLIKFVYFNRKTLFCLGCWQCDCISGWFVLRLPSSPNRLSMSFYSFAYFIQVDYIGVFKFYYRLFLAIVANYFLCFLRILSALNFEFPYFQNWRCFYFVSFLYLFTSNLLPIKIFLVKH